jgi:hypothetical protein
VTLFAWADLNDARTKYRRSYGHGRVRAFRRLVMATARSLI